MIVIDGENLIVGRVATFVAKKALLGETVKIINCEKMYFTGDRAFLLQDFKRRREQGIHTKGPFFYRVADRMIRRVVRGMLPYKTPRGLAAYKRVMCYTGVPEEYKNQKAITIESATIKKVPNLKYVRVDEISRLLGSVRL